MESKSKVVIVLFLLQTGRRSPAGRWNSLFDGGESSPVDCVFWMFCQEQTLGVTDILICEFSEHRN